MVLHYPRGVAVVAVFLSALAGFVDAMGFITLGGYFVSFMSGNSTKLAVSLGEGLVGTALTGAGIVVLFVIGVMAGSFTGRTAGRSHRQAVLTLVAVLLALAATAPPRGGHARRDRADGPGDGAENATSNARER